MTPAPAPAPAPAPRRPRALIARAAGHTGAAARAAYRRVTENLWPVAQQTAAATLSWWIARHVIHHHQPVFAPITTLVALNTARGGRGTNAVRFVAGVVAGVLVAEAAVALLGPGYPTIALAVFLAILAALVVGGERVTMAQAAVSAVIAVGTGIQAGSNRVVDALLGAGVALVFSQLLFPAHPLALLRRAESGTLADLAEALALTVRAVDGGDAGQREWTWEHLRAAYARLAELGEARADAGTAARRSPVWWGRREPVERESRYAAGLDLLGASCLTLTRTVLALDPGRRADFTPAVAELSRTLRSLAAAPGDHAVRQRAAERALGAAALAPALADGEAAETAAAATGGTMVVLDILAFVGVPADEARAAVRARTTRIRVGAPPTLRWTSAPRLGGGSRRGA
ncbi:FUSC family protein [Streptomyces sp. NPDC085995]|uniref:FUSC family protein n=1 Tax=Streptomyces sp. NPDC085995 TaxID=3154861 RepID=UPI0034426578